MSELTLFQIDDALLQLIEAREELQEIIAQGPDEEERQERVAELAEVERLLVEYRAQLPAKVDRVRGFLLHAENAAAVHRKEAARQAALARMWESREEQVKEMAAFVIGAVPERKRLTGATGYLLLKGNGGLAPLEITDPEQVPEDCCKYVGWIGGVLWAELKRLIPAGFSLHPAWLDFRLERVIDNERVRQALPVPGAHLGERGKHVEIK